MDSPSSLNRLLKVIKLNEQTVTQSAVYVINGRTIENSYHLSKFILGNMRLNRRIYLPPRRIGRARGVPAVGHGHHASNGRGALAVKHARQAGSTGRAALGAKGGLYYCARNRHRWSLGST